MGTLFRSEEMQLSQLFLQSESAYNTVAELGELGLVQFRDLNPDVNAFQRKFVNEVRRCDEIQRKLRYLEKEIKKDGIPMLDVGDNPEAPHQREMIDLESTFEKLEGELKEVNSNAEVLKKSYLELTELRHILKKTQQFFDEMQDTAMADDSVQLLCEEGLRAGGQTQMRLGFVAGVILRERLPAFERMLWRVCRGNVFLRQAEIETPLEDPHTGDNVYKSVFIIFFQGEQLRSRVKKICEGFRATLYPCPDTPPERREMIGGVISRIEDLNTVLSQTNEHRHRVLVAAAKNIKGWFIKVHKMKAIYHTLNMFNLDVTQKCLIAECWCATDDVQRIQLALQTAAQRSGSNVPSIMNRMETLETPPTFNRTNKVTSSFQGIVNSYGIASYREVNPAPYTIITFPFLFAVMFGDAGHGLIMTLCALWMVLKEKNLSQNKGSEMWMTFFNGRYMILLMGIFSIYTGFIYNDVFSKSVNIFGTSWTPAKPAGNATFYPEHVTLDPAYTFSGSPYPFGMDPLWQVSENKILFYNSFKMKLSIVLGITQMGFGVGLSLINHNYFNSQIDIITEFIPRVIWLVAIFGYMVLLIFVKWFFYDHTTSSCAPSVLIMMINMFLYKYPKPEEAPCYLLPIYPGQQLIQTLLLLAALICIPWMLLLKPFLVKKQHDKAEHLERLEQSNNVTGYGATYDVDNPHQTGDDGHVAITMSQSSHAAPKQGQNEEPHTMLDLFIHQSIHTIEYCLGSISHTASYLRLWALSLAHAQLSEVLWTMVMRVGLTSSGIFGGIAMYLVFAFWAVLTVAVLLLMEGLSAFLHALRLHWVEFQSKFYKGDGHLFMPFSFDESFNADSQTAVD
ncbi:V-type proton ATPase 116 kDa subunit a isoform 1, partial [Fragariocoptes setiger]